MGTNSQHNVVSNEQQHKQSLLIAWTESKKLIYNMEVSFQSWVESM